MKSWSFPYTLVPLSEGLSYIMVLVPLLGLGSDKVDDAIIITDHKVKAYHIGKHQRIYDTALRDRIDAIDENQMDITTIMLFVSSS